MSTTGADLTPLLRVSAGSVRRSKLNPTSNTGSVRESDFEGRYGVSLGICRLHGQDERDERSSPSPQGRRPSATPGLGTAGASTWARCARRTAGAPRPTLPARRYARRARSVRGDDRSRRARRKRSGRRGLPLPGERHQVRLKPARVFRFPRLSTEIATPRARKLLRSHAIAFRAPAPGDARSPRSPSPTFFKCTRENKRFLTQHRKRSPPAQCVRSRHARVRSEMQQQFGLPVNGVWDASSASCSTTPACEPRRRPPRGRSCPRYNRTRATGSTAGSTGQCRVTRLRRRGGAKSSGPPASPSAVTGPACWGGPARNSYRRGRRQGGRQAQGPRCASTRRAAPRRV